MINQQIRDEYNRLEIGRLDGSRADVDNYKKLCLDLKNIEKEITNAQKIVYFQFLNLNLTLGFGLSFNFIK